MILSRTVATGTAALLTTGRSHLHEVQLTAASGVTATVGGSAATCVYPVPTVAAGSQPLVINLLLGEELYLANGGDVHVLETGT